MVPWTGIDELDRVLAELVTNAQHVFGEDLGRGLLAGVLRPRWCRQRERLRLPGRHRDPSRPRPLGAVGHFLQSVAAPARLLDPAPEWVLPAGRRSSRPQGSRAALAL